MWLDLTYNAEEKVGVLIEASNGRVANRRGLNPQEFRQEGLGDRINVQGGPKKTVHYTLVHIFAKY